ncbi:MAG: c-type cytochrome [Gemmatimonadetes bacterium]|nr:c-type cytochrome [Gemmatimonadota bacterium]
MFGSIRLATALALLCAVSACDFLTPSAPPASERLDGFIDGLEPGQVRSHLTGDEEFARRFSVSDGLGPIFVATSCEQCHVGDGKGHPVFNLQRFGRSTPAGFDPMTEMGGPQLQHRAVPGYPAESIPSGVTGVSRFTPPAVTGLGYLDALEDSTLIALADPNDTDGDGISGRLQIHPPSELIETVLALEAAGSPDPGARGTLVDGGYIGRFGKKGLTVNLLHQTVGAYHEDMGITTDLIPEDLFNVQQGGRVSDAAPDPEVSSATVADVVFYLKTLRVPSRRNADDPQVTAGEALFEDVGCAACHVPTLQTGRSEIAVLNQMTFHPYTDLLLHDMGPALDDGYTEGRALTSEWRTPPLWGLGIQENFQGGTAFYLHDGRASSLEDAIDYHGGEAQASRDAFFGLDSESRAALIAFLRSL